MLKQLQKRESQSGFTIIEVLIVLAIAGLILLIVFLAVPALQRNAHNTSIKNDVSSVLGAMSEYANNNDGALPTATTGSTATKLVVTGGASTNPADAAVGYVDGTTITITTATGAVALPGTASPGTVQLYTHAVCSGNSGTNSGATARNFIALYKLEGGALECQAS